MRVIQLTQGKVAIIDDEDFDLVSKYKWSAIKLSDKHSWYAVTNIKRGGTRRSVRMHQLLLGFPAEVVDHRDGDGLNNRKSNLRACTQHHNIMNARPHRKGTSRFKGVSAYSGKWRAQIQIDKQKIYLGTFEQEADAAQAYNFAAHEHFGEFAYQNRANT